LKQASNQQAPLQLIPLRQLSVIRISGEERSKYLQGQVTCDIAALTAGDSTIGAHCDPKGKMWSVFRLAVLPDEILWLQHASVTPSQLPELKKYSVFSKVSIEDASQSWHCYGLAGDHAQDWMAKHYGQEVAEQGGLLGEDGIALRLQLPAPRFLLLLHQPAAGDLATLPRAGDDNPWRQLDIEAGYPWLEAAGSGEFIPQMLNLQALGGISFSKGCYTGQETVARMKYLGRNKRALFILCGQSEEMVAAGSSVEAQLGENWRRNGNVINGVTLDQQVWLLAVLPNDSQPEQRFRLAERPQVMLTLRPLPYSLESSE